MKSVNTLNDAHDMIITLKKEISKRIVGMDEVFKFVCICLFAPGHMLLEGVPGLAKTLFFKTLAAALSADFRRISFAADLLPKDVVGIERFNEKTGKIELVVPGPLFANFLLADELNRARSTSKASVLEPMEEGQITTELGGTYLIPQPFMVLATQNPLEQEGVFPLSRAEQDRFIMKVLVGYPSAEEEKEIIVRYSEDMELAPITPVINRESILDIRKIIQEQVYVGDEIIRKVRDLVRETRPENSQIEEIKRLVDVPGGGASPRAGIYIVRAAKVHAILRGTDCVTPEDLVAVVIPILRHRIVFKPGAVEEAREEVILEKLVNTILGQVL